MTITAPRHPGGTVPIYDPTTKEPVGQFHAARPHNVHRDLMVAVPLDALVCDEEGLEGHAGTWYLSKDLEEWDLDMEVWYIEPDREHHRRHAS